MDVELSPAGESVMNIMMGEILVNTAVTLKQFAQNVQPNIVHVNQSVLDYYMDLNSPHGQIKLVQQSLISRNEEYRFYAASNFGLVISKLEMFPLISKELESDQIKRREFENLKGKRILNDK